MTKLLQQCFLFFIVVVILGHNLGNSQVSVYRTIVPTLVSYCMTMGDDEPPGCGQFRPQGHDWQDLCRVPLNIAYVEYHLTLHTKYTSFRPCGFREDF